MPTTSAARPFAEAPTIFASCASGVTSASSSRVTHAATDIIPAISPLWATSQAKSMPSRAPRNVSTSVSAAMTPTAAAATIALRGRPASAAKKLVASRSMLSAAAGDIAA